MRVRYSFSSRRTRNIDNMRKQRSKFPDLLVKVLKEADIILEVIDARFVQDTSNLELEKEISERGKQIIYVINKSDLAKKTEIKVFPYVFVSCKNRRGIRELRNKIKEFSKKIKKPMEGKFDQVVVGVIGYPNTGKSSLINLLIGKSSAGVGSDAGFTKGLQKLKLTKDIILIDSPGVIPKKEYTSSNSLAISKHTSVGARSYSQVRNPELVVADLMTSYPKVFQKYYGIETEDSEDLLEQLGVKWNIFIKGGVVNQDAVARRILKDWQHGKIRVK